ncbi:MAG TPA: flavodoxin family protein [Bacillota bacterium]|nr:flavodoxin family protein [Bacillota bacterium]
MQTLVVYSSKTGNTRKVAETIAAVFGVRAQSCAEIQGIPKADLLVAGSGVYGGRMGQDLAALINRIPAGAVKKALVFGTIGGQTSAVEAIENALEDKGIEVLGNFYCKGQAWWLLNRKRPNEQDLAAAREFALNVKKELESGV